MAGKDPQMPKKEVLLDQWQQTIKVLHTKNTEEQAPGADADADWDATIQVLSSAGLLGSPKERSAYYDNAFQPTGK